MRCAAHQHDGMHSVCCTWHNRGPPARRAPMAASLPGHQSSQQMGLRAWGSGSTAPVPPQCATPCALKVAERQGQLTPDQGINTVNINHTKHAGRNCCCVSKLIPIVRVYNFQQPQNGTHPWLSSALWLTHPVARLSHQCSCPSCESAAASMQCKSIYMSSLHQHSATTRAWSSCARCCSTTLRIHARSGDDRQHATAVHLTSRVGLTHT